jgi:hypothetical protein
MGKKRGKNCSDGKHLASVFFSAFSNQSNKRIPGDQSPDPARVKPALLEDREQGEACKSYLRLWGAVEWIYLVIVVSKKIHCGAGAIGVLSAARTRRGARRSTFPDTSVLRACRNAVIVDNQRA